MHGTVSQVSLIPGFGSFGLYDWTGFSLTLLFGPWISQGQGVTSRLFMLWTNSYTSQSRFIPLPLQVSTPSAPPLSAAQHLHPSIPFSTSPLNTLLLRSEHLQYMPPLSSLLFLLVLDKNQQRDRRQYEK
ncbi:hypothetical protein HYFRA_00003548 [Hymenoscyphus fraxineus]|uniref:Uncharacterized protein n=1 Tax=Hymenoscyphus fraxineus TaxID=746836 RepID=A0A9N9KXK8_9HELO|nr:hypothetical protein HYFRA_00003548 [Hymenoscyphus fraxineus]